MQSAYKTEQLIDEGVDFSNIYAEKQGVVKEMTGFDFDLSRIVQFLQKETKQFTVQLPLALDIDRSINSIYLKWKESKGEEAEAKPQPKREEPKAEPKKETSPQVAEWKEAAETLKDFIDMGSTQENIAEWTEALETINMFLETEEPKMAKGGGVYQDWEDIIYRDKRYKDLMLKLDKKTNKVIGEPNVVYLPFADVFRVYSK